MKQVLWRWRGIEIHSYPVMLYLGLVLGVTAGNYAANLAGLNSAAVFVATILLAIPALLGARLFYVATHRDIYRQEPARIWRRSEGGAVLYGGLPLALLASVPLLGLLQLPFGAFWDVATFTILVGMIFGRFGCLLNGCCAGRSTEGWLALHLPDHRGLRKRRIPTQLLEAGWTTMLLGGGILLYNSVPFPGALFLYALAGYGIGRLLLESTREQEDRGGGLAVSRAISAALVVTAAVAFLIAWPR